EKKGTALGNAVWRSLELFDKVSAKKTLVIVGDGDETAGNISARYAAEISKSKR
ncbi:MAG: hypothetical protein GY816_17440, partial [Cytophagales bacterium]|nr:hypothetical protein [Cytophagales bacterium]